MKYTFFILFLLGTTLLQAQENQPLPKSTADELVFEVVETMPIFPGCESFDTQSERIKCSNEKLILFLQKNAPYTDVAKELGIEGTIYIRFRVETDGSIGDIEVIKDITAGVGGLRESALRAVEKMNTLNPKWTPGKQRGIPVRVSLTIPIKFELKKTKLPDSTLKK